MSIVVTTTERELLQAIHEKVDELAKLLQDANSQAFHVNFNINPLLGACDRFDVIKMVPIDLKAGAN